ncbi:MULTISPECIES: cupin domain-containing protein [Burkholderia]|uniref:AraC family transcriptional regulator n=1 Tax=Burkholderia diffusa TaxID=488732 RepID=A0A6P2Q0R1_9BURK|nr:MULTISPECIES: AraC family transcriptional regulator [Burkholderia]AOI98836.1 AraC family transcriptional regulator [Burkholderia sp. LA-2-3-30-S1-D2]KAB0662088.1 AraC family transcriptional regulator [Burkholderia diffusa]KVE10573.1 AraC family transcriptional regulator [Burkholderia sp. LA-2-3-30-S1-D2]MBM2655519.1 cupin domain-containing protein [Burkholderia diffusa]RQR80772.1 AraC family transcriptional regulator [Burkholderia sp. Bp9012]
MDALSQLLSLGRSHVELDVRCLLDGPFAMPHDPLPPGEAAFHLVLAGTCRMRTADGRTLQLADGDFVLLPAGGAHDLLDAGAGRLGPVAALRDLGTGGGTVLPVKSNLDPAEPGGASVDLLCGRFVYARGAGELLMRTLPHVLHVGLREASGFAPLQLLTSVLRTEASNGQPGAGAIVNALGQALLAYALRAYGRGARVPSGWLALAADARLGPSVQAVLQAPEKPWTVESLGDASAMSRATYARHFRERAGMSVGAFIAQIRMMHACALLQDTQRGQAEIGQAVGYQSEAAFGKAFRAVLGTTPGRWRRAQRDS